MRLIRGIKNAAGRARGCVVTIGNFDGVHLGHQALIARARGLAQAQNLALTVLTFEPTPREFFARGAPQARVSTFRGKVRDLAAQGIDELIVQRFSAGFAAVTAEDFVRDMLVARLRAQAVVVGDDFRFGAGRAGDVALLRRLGAPLGLQADALGTVEVAGLRCSSSAVRAALATPDLPRVRALLGRDYSMLGHVRPGLQLGRKLGMPTTNIFLQRRPALKLGVYAVRATVNGQTWDGVANIGVRPTLGTTRCLLETHLFGEPGILYGRIMDVTFHQFLREELRFDSLDALAARMQEDKREALAFFAGKPP